MWSSKQTQIFNFKNWKYFGGLCNILMLGDSDKTTIEFVEERMRQISVQSIKQLIGALGSLWLPSSQSIYQKFYQVILKQYRQKLSERVNRDAITSELVARAFTINSDFGSKLGSMLQSEFLVNVLKKEAENPASTVPNVEKPATVSNGTNNQVGEIVPPMRPNPTANQNIFGKAPPPVSRSNGFLGNLGDNKTSENCVNLINKPQCLCDSQKQIRLKDESSFKCVHCNRLYHTVCMKKKPTSQFCCYCHLEKMVPLKRPIKTIFVGLMKKTKKKHVANFVIPDIDPSQKVQVRCLRLKEGAQLSCLFPDVAELSMNGQRCNMFEPINKQSCLKYRKDQPFNLLKTDFYKGQENIMTVSQNIQVSREKDFRNEPENHIIGLYVIEDVKIQQLITGIKSENTLGFSESENVLRQSFGLGRDDEITCQLVKIPLLCPLTTVKIQIPARGAYCTHFQCFDLRNYLTLISQSQNPRWKCPLCNCLAFEFNIDSILQEIIRETKSNQRIKEILFFKNGDYSMIIDDEPLPERKNIRGLKIPERNKQIYKEPEPLQRPKKRPNFVIPQNTQIISLDD